MRIPVIEVNLNPLKGNIQDLFIESSSIIHRNDKKKVYGDQRINSIIFYNNSQLELIWYYTIIIITGFFSSPRFFAVYRRRSTSESRSTLTAWFTRWRSVTSTTTTTCVTQQVPPQHLRAQRRSSEYWLTLRPAVSGLKYWYKMNIVMLDAKIHYLSIHYLSDNEVYCWFYESKFEIVKMTCLCKKNKQLRKLV